jgi:hypothetical protein
MGTELTPNPRNAQSTALPMYGDAQEGLYTPTVDQKYRLGQELWTQHGSLRRKWRYVKAGATQLEAALMCTSEAPAGGLLEEVAGVGYTSSIGDKNLSMTVTTGNGITDGELQDGLLVVNKVTGIGYMYPISDNRWITSDTILNLDLYEPIRIATDATTEFSILKCPYMDVIVAATTITAAPIGVPQTVIAANYYGWVQVKGPCAMLVDAGDTIVIGEPAGKPGTNGTAGGVGLVANDGTDVVYGRVMYAATGAETAIIDLQLE